MTREEYLCRKEKLLREKAAGTDRLAEIRRNGNHWLETFINAAHQAEIVSPATISNRSRISLKRIGSNLRLSGRAARGRNRRK